jgi:hypothetical protein
VAAGLERVILGILKDHVPGVAPQAAVAADVRELKVELAEMQAEIAALRALLKAGQQSAEERA